MVPSSIKGVAGAACELVKHVMRTAGGGRRQATACMRVCVGRRTVTDSKSRSFGGVHLHSGCDRRGLSKGEYRARSGKDGGAAGGEDVHDERPSLMIETIARARLWFIGLPIGLDAWLRA